MRFAVVVLVALVAGCSTVAPTVAPTAVPLAIDTARALAAPPGGVIACAQASLGLVVVHRNGDRLAFLSAASNQTVDVVWPHGFSARVVDGMAELLDPSGAVVGSEGMTIGPLGGGRGATDAFYVCSVGNRIYT